MLTEPANVMDESFASYKIPLNFREELVKDNHALKNKIFPVLFINFLF